MITGAAASLLFAKYRLYFQIGILALILGAIGYGLYRVHQAGYTSGQNAAQVACDSRIQAVKDAQIEERDEALAESARLRDEAKKAADIQHAKDLAAAEKRAADRVRQALERGRLEGATRRPGSAYVSPSCVLEPAEKELLDGIIKRGSAL